MSVSEMTCYTERLGPYVLSPFLRENGRRIILVSYKGDIRTIQGRPHRTLSLNQALGLDFQPGDTLQFLPDKYWPECYGEAGEERAGPTRPFEIKGLRGRPGAPITFRGMGSPTILCGARSADPIYPLLPAASDFAFFQLFDCEWVVFDNFQVGDCWPCFLFGENVRYLTVRRLAARDSMYLIFVKGENSHHLLVEDNSWQQDPSRAAWTDLPWNEMHGSEGSEGDYRYLNGGLFGCVEIPGSVIIRRNLITDAYNGVRLCAGRDGATDIHNVNVEVYDNDFIKLRDNAVEPENSATNWYIHHNRIGDNHAPLSFDGVEGGFWYLFSNRLWFSQACGQATDPNSAGKILKIADKREPFGPAFFFNNSLFMRVPFIKKGQTNDFHFFNNIFAFGSPDDFPHCVCPGNLELIGRKFLKKGWVESVTFDYDLTNRPWPDFIIDSGQETHGYVEPNFRFLDPAVGNLRPPRGYSLPAGQAIQFRSGRDWMGDYDWMSGQGEASPNVGAFQGEDLFPGPPFAFRPTKAQPDERPRIVQLERSPDRVVVHFSTPVADLRGLEVLIQPPGSPDQRVKAKNVCLSGTRLTFDLESSSQIPDMSVAEIILPAGLKSRQEGLDFTSWGNVDERVITADSAEFWS